MPTGETTASAFSNAHQWVRASPLVTPRGTGGRRWSPGSVPFGIDVVGISRRNLDALQGSSVVRSADRCGDVRTYKVALTKRVLKRQLGKKTYRGIPHHIELSSGPWLKGINLISLSTPMSAIC